MKELMRIGFVCGIAIALLLMVFAPAVVNIGSSDESKADETIDREDEPGKKNNEGDDNTLDIDDIRKFIGRLNSIDQENTGFNSEEHQDNNNNNNNNDLDSSGQSVDDNDKSSGYNEHNIEGGPPVLDDSHESTDDNNENIFESSSDDPQNSERDNTIYSSSIIVDDGGDGDYLTIQAAIDAATPGDTIYVWGGVYYEDVKVNKTVSLIGNGTSATFVVGSGTATVMLISADRVQMTGFRINGSGSSIYFKSGMSIYGSDNVTIDQCDISNNNNGIFVRNCSYLKLTNNTCSYTNRYGIYLEHVSNSEVSANICNYNVFDGIKYIGLSWRSNREK